jgi:hypothetical protein
MGWKVAISTGTSATRSELPTTSVWVPRSSENCTGPRAKRIEPGALQRATRASDTGRLSHNTRTSTGQERGLKSKLRRAAAPGRT